MKALLSLSLAVIAGSMVLGGCAANTGGEEAGDEADITASRATFETFKGVDNKTYFHLVGGNGELVLQSQGYSSNQKADQGVASVKTNNTPDNYRVLEAADGSAYFNIVAGNGEIIAVSEMYSSKSNATAAAKSVRSLVGRIKRWETVAAKPAASFAEFKGMDGQYYFNLRAKNGEIILQSEGYTTKENALKGIGSVRAWSRWSTEVFEAADGQYGVHVVASNGEIVGHGETYSTKSNATAAAKRIGETMAVGNSIPGPDKS